MYNNTIMLLVRTAIIAVTLWEWGETFTFIDTDGIPCPFLDNRTLRQCFESS